MKAVVGLGAIPRPFPVFSMRWFTMVAAGSHRGLLRPSIVTRPVQQHPQAQRACRPQHVCLVALQRPLYTSARFTASTLSRANGRPLVSAASPSQRASSSGSSRRVSSIPSPPPSALAQDLFALFGLPVQYPLNEGQLDSAYKELQKRLHPDKHAGSTEVDMKQATDSSARVNDAYQVCQPLLKCVCAVLAVPGRVPFDPPCPQHSASRPSSPLCFSH